MFASLNDVAASVSALSQPDEEMREQARLHQSQLTKPPTALGQLEELAIFMAGWRDEICPSINRAQALVFAGNHGVCAQGVNPFPQEVTAQMVANFAHGGAAINQLAALADAELAVHPLSLDGPTGDISVAPAMDEAALLEAINIGAAAVDSTADVVILGEMGIGNSTISAALCAGCFGGDASQWVGRGTGADDAQIKKKAEIVNRATVRMHQHNIDDMNTARQGLFILRQLGGREQAALCGAVLAARASRQIVMLDGFICTSAVAPLHIMSHDMLSHCLVAHKSREPGHQKLLSCLGKQPLLDLDLCLGEGSGAAIGLMILRAAMACHNGMASFAQAEISTS